MALLIKVSADKVPAPSVVPAQQVQDAAAKQGNAFANRAIAITMPKIHFETNKLSFETQMDKKAGLQFRFQTGTLPLTLRQEILVSDALSQCARDIWLLHEQDHVTDNESILNNKLESELRKDADFADILLFPKWAPVGPNKDNFNKTQKKIGERIGAVFQALTSAAAQARDTDAEYKRVEAEIKKTCK